MNTAVVNGIWTLHQLKDKGLPGLDDTDIRNRWLYECTETFTTVQEAITYLESLSPKS